MEIRALTVEDVYIYNDSLIELLYLCFENTYDQKVNRDFITSRIDSLLFHIKDGTAYTYAALDGAEMLGFVWAYPVLMPTETVFHIAYIAVCEMAQGRGIGQRLLTTVEKTAAEKGIKSVELIVGEGNRRAAKFYRDMNYNIDRLVLKKRI